MDFHHLSLCLSLSPFPSPFPFPNETPRRLPVHELQGVVSQSRLKRIVVYSFPFRASPLYPTIRELPDAFGFFSLSNQVSTH